ncbi:4-aminobutyrate aminotransferase / (S)-3-amino-2-methylpropionate transaminase [Saccharopolyspora antimicrobica]|uniref:(S)-3-amino-2-methylpropionate transaminase n=1 Tax=Saccharopolyspora antimicrobica TaxID=455193 RepID=A0A1I4T159_9PSEU|nr:4-aminobutyrate--2-oxoglutarate transaminase [Saccharopolyspora antimicrobica]RKT85916.1 4-aminobutyrate aminotransferase/(S)-3-amino-2-methylpropionate transaminase [Saccharopolyspora antimicrobica]SFM70464.1 4-aminobutyrate aminotransferase / (S)-3-amino-2-methylpropionate transaminase [Saccharopolyspora antimicrobica]
MTTAQARVLRTEIPGPNSRELQRRRAATVAGGVASVLPVYITEAAGGVLHDVDGNSLIDLGSGIAVTNVGNAAPEVVEPVRRQVAEFTHTCFMVTPYENYLQVCEELAALTPGDHEKRSALFNSGAEAVENAVKIARRATGRPAIVAFDHAYHGRTNLTMALTAKSVPYKHGFGPFAPEVYRVPMSYPARDGRPGEQVAREAIERIDKQLGADQVAAVLIEPIQGEGGFIEPAPGFLPAIAKWCADNGVLFIADEIQTGFCRTGTWFACDHENVVPDLITTAKGIAGGLPLAAVTGRAELMDAMPPSSLGGTYGGNPIACAGALGAIRAMRERDLAAAARAIGDLVLPRLRALTTEAILDVRGRGAMIGIEFVKPGTTEPDPELTAKIAKTCHARGVVLLTCGTYGNVIRLLPPLVIDHALLTEGLEVLEEAIREHTS